MKQQKKERDESSKKISQSAQDKGLLLARLLQKAVQNKKKSISSAHTTTNQILSNEIQAQSCIKKPLWREQKEQYKQQLSQTFSESINQTAHTISIQDKQSTYQEPNKLKNHPNSKVNLLENKNIMFKNDDQQDIPRQGHLKQVFQTQSGFIQARQSKISIKQKIMQSESEISFDDSLLIEPSFATNYAQEVGQMLKFIYVQFFGQEKYQNDLKRYQQIEINPQEYRIDPTQEFNKEGKLLQNIIFEIKTLKNNINSQKTQSHELSTELDQAYVKMQLQQRQICGLQEQIMRLQKKLLNQQESPVKNNRFHDQMKSQYSLKLNGEYQKILQENQLMQGTMAELQEENIKLQNTIEKLNQTIQSLQNTIQEQKIRIEKLQLQLSDTNSKLLKGTNNLDKINAQSAQPKLQSREDKELRLEQKITSLKEQIEERDNQIENLLLIICELQKELTQIRQDIDNKENAQNEQKILLEQQIRELTEKNALMKQKNEQIQEEKQQFEKLVKQKTQGGPQMMDRRIEEESSFDIRQLSTIKEDQSQQDLINNDNDQGHIEKSNKVNVSEFILESGFKMKNHHQFVGKQTQTHSLSLHETDSQVQLERLVLELKKVLAHKEKTILKYEKQMEAHESDAQKYENFISELSAQIQQLQRSINRQKTETQVSKKVQTEQKYITIMNIAGLEKTKNDKVESGPNEENQPSIAEQIYLEQMKTKQQQLTQTDKEMKKLNLIPTSHPSLQKEILPDNQLFNLSSNLNQISDIITHDKFLDEVSMTLSQFSQTEELSDIRNLTKELSHAYDKIIALTYEISHLRQINTTLASNSKNFSIRS